jgi:hypothetical protein
MYHAPSKEKVVRKEKRKEQARAGDRDRDVTPARTLWVLEGWGRAGCRKLVGSDARESGVVLVCLVIKSATMSGVGVKVLETSPNSTCWRQKWMRKSMWREAGNVGGVECHGDGAFVVAEERGRKCDCPKPRSRRRKRRLRASLVPSDRA